MTDRDPDYGHDCGPDCTCFGVTGEEDVEMAPRLDGAIEPNALAPKGSSSAATSIPISNDPTKRVETMTTPEGAKGWADQAGSAQVLAGGHGLDVAPDASPEGVRAETRRREQDGGGEPSNAPNAVLTALAQLQEEVANTWVAPLVDNLVAALVELRQEVEFLIAERDGAYRELRRVEALRARGERVARKALTLAEQVYGWAVHEPNHHRLLRAVAELREELTS